jgi:(p)ppGpp synthase/HD superfamily hydrolase
MGKISEFSQHDIEVIARDYADLKEAARKRCADASELAVVQKAFDFANEAHKGVRRRSGEPYILHPIAVAKIVVSNIGLGYKSIVAALLHDVVEDTAVTMGELAKELPAELIDILKLLTHDDDVEYFTYVRAIKNHPIAKKVKLADIAHNSDQSRCVGSGLTEEQLAYWKQKYQKALEILSE